jgi:hypothetical protein
MIGESRAVNIIEKHEVDEIKMRLPKARATLSKVITI